MGYLAIFLAMEGRRCVVIGGGNIAARKVAQLLAAGAQVTVISPRMVRELAVLAESVAITYLPRKWERGDLRGFELAFAATDDADAHREIASEARAFGVMLNVADEPELCDFIAPAVVRRGDLQIAVSTSGASPATAARIRRELEHRFGWEYAAALRILRAARDYLFANEPDISSRGRKLAALAASDLTGRLRAGDRAAVERLLVSHLGVGLDKLAQGAGEDTGEWFRSTAHEASSGD
ncbi:MAG TPA: bifunctional precorrin-2 dehydrogenase/sirohydrochlorin ferrochelatase [Candidatus Binataceae bacterium]|nr:bifunctional precorrin-2 dehydrogenase/sirohydrochlorin ferrochelatase [Candidatus Binataceae bacterium]